MEQSRITKSSFLIKIAIGCLITFIFGIPTFFQLKIGDFNFHIGLAKELANSGYLYLRANILFERMLLIVRDILPFNFLARTSVLIKQIIELKSFDISALFVSTGSYLLVYYILWDQFNSILPKGENRWLRIGSALASLIVMLVGPIFLFTYPERQYFGYVNGNPYHSPTYLLMRPFALLFFVCFTDHLFTKPSWKSTLVCCGAILAATLAKPNYTLSILPSIVVTLLLLLKKYKLYELNKRLILFAVILMPIVTLISQYIIMYTGDRGDRIIFSPFEAILLQTPNVQSVVVFSFLSILFPIGILFTNWNKHKESFPFVLAWVNLVVSIIYAFCLAEQADMASLNFWWTPAIAVFILFFISIKYYWEMIIDSIQLRLKLPKKIYVLGFLLLLHLICGIIFYSTFLTPRISLV